MKAGQRLAKDLHQYLIAGDVEAYTLRRLGWWDFLASDVPDTDDARVVGAHAAYALLLDSDGHRHNYEPNILYAILVYVRADRGGGDVATRLENGFLAVTNDPPVQLDDLVDWFLRVFP